MKVSVVSAADLGNSECDKWRQLQEAHSYLASPYFCPEFTQAVAAVRNDVYVGVVENGADVMAFFPFQRGAMRKGRPVGGALSDCHGLIGNIGSTCNAIDLIRACGLRNWHFDHLIAAQQLFSVHHRILTGSPFMDLRGGYTAYAEQRRCAGTRQIIKVEALLRKLRREHGEVQFEFHSFDREAFQKLLSWKSAQYRRSDNVDIFQFRWTTSLLDTIMGTANPGFAGVLSTLRVNGRLIAVHSGMRSQSVFHYWFPAYDVEFSQYSPGLILLLMIAKEAASRGILTVDLGKGDALYKRRLASGETALAEGCVEISGLISWGRCLRRRVEHWAFQSPLKKFFAAPGRLLKNMERRTRFR